MGTEFMREVNALLIKALIMAMPAMIVDLLFALAVLRDAKKQVGKGLKMELAGPKLWALATFFGGVLVAGMYWVIHHSALRQVEKVEARREKEWA
jgi:hypothetical protein